VLFFYLVLAGSGLVMFGYLEHLLSDWRGALVAAVAYITFPYHSHVGVETWIHALIWLLLPLSFWTIELSITKNARRTHYLLLTGIIAAAFPIVSSEYTIIAGPFVALYFMARQGREIYRRNQTWLGALESAALVGAVAVGLSSFYVLPSFLEVKHVGIHMKHATRGTVPGRVLADYSVTPRLVLHAIAKRLHLPLHLKRLPQLVYSFWSISWYPGLVVTGLAIVGIGTGYRRFKVACALAGLVLTLLLSMGPTLTVALSRLPVLGRLTPFRYVLPAVFFGCILVGYGAQWLLEHRRLRSYWLSSAVGLALVFLVVIDFWPSAAAYRVTDSYFSADEQKAYAWLGEQEGRGRLWEGGGSVRDAYVRTCSLFQVLRLRHAGYYDNGAPLYTWQQGRWTDRRTALRLHHVRYVMLREGDEGLDEIRDELEDYELVFASGDVQIWENPQIGAYAQFYDTVAFDAARDFHYPFDALPKFVRRHIAMVSAPCYNCEPLSASPAPELGRYDYFLVDDGTATSERIQPLRALEGGVVTTEDLDGLEKTRQVEASVWSERQDYGNVQLQVQTSEAGVLSIAESWYPHWRVWVDDVPREVLRVNWALLGVWLEPGAHRVTFRFQRPWYVYLGLLMSSATLLALGTWGTRYVSGLLYQPRPSLEDLPKEYREKHLDL
jgi:hypothetical protein